MKVKNIIDELKKNIESHQKIQREIEQLFEGKKFRVGEFENLSNQMLGLRRKIKKQLEELKR